MKILHLISGGETGGSKNHLLSLLEQFSKDEILLGVLEEGLLSKEAKEKGIPTIVFNQSSRYDFSVLSKLKKTIKEHEIQFVHTHGARANLYAYMVRKRISFKWVTTIHSDPSLDFMKGGLKGKAFTWINMRVLKKIDFFFAVSNRFKEMLVQFGLSEKKIHVIYNGISFDIPDYQPLSRKDFGYRPEELLIIMVARLHPIKGHELVFTALKELIEAGQKNVSLLLIGDGPLKAELAKSVKDKNLERYIRFEGFQSNIHGYLEMADVELLASYSESFPLVLLESARARTSIISTDVGGVSDLIATPDYGWLIEPGNKVELKEAILSAAKEKATGELTEKGLKIFERASTHYSITHLYDSIRKEYQNMTAK